MEMVCFFVNSEVLSLAYLVHSKRMRYRSQRAVWGDCHDSLWFKPKVMNTICIVLFVHVRHYQGKLKRHIRAIPKTRVSNENKLIGWYIPGHKSSTNLRRRRGSLNKFVQTLSKGFTKADRFRVYDKTKSHMQSKGLCRVCASCTTRYVEGSAYGGSANIFQFRYVGFLLDKYLVYWTTEQRTIE